MHRQALNLRLDIKRCTIIKIHITWGGGGTTRVLFCSDNNSIVIYILNVLHDDVNILLSPHYMDCI